MKDENHEDVAALYDEALLRLAFHSPSAVQPLYEAFDRTARIVKKPRRLPVKTLRDWLGDYVLHLQRECGLTCAGSAVYEQDLRQYLAWLSAQNIEAPSRVSSALVERYAHDLRAGQLRPARRAKLYAPPTIARKLNNVREFHRYVARGAKCPDPATALEPPIAPPVLSRDLAPEQITALLRSLNTRTALGVRDCALIELLCAGLDGGQIAALRPADFDAMQRCVRVGKNSVSLSEMACAALQNYLNRARPRLVARQNQRANRLRVMGAVPPKGYAALLFFNTRGAPLSVSVLHQMVRRHAVAAHLPDWVTPHVLQQVRRPVAPGSARAATQRLRRTFLKAHPRA